MTIQILLYHLRRNVTTATAFVLIVLLLAVAALGPALVPYDPLATDMSHVLAPPSSSHWFGTDQLGRDIFSRVIAATRLDFAIAVCAVMVSAAAGVCAGALCGYLGGLVDAALSRMIDVLLAFPLFVAAMALVAVFGNSVQSVVLATAIINFPFYFRLARAQAVSLRSIGYVEAALINGNSTSRVIFGFILPNSLPPVIVQISLNLGWAILNTASLAFIGLGVGPPTPEWGVMIQEGATLMMAGQWWTVVFPGLALVLSVFCFALLGDGLRDIVDPRRRS
ncbi:ABC transporter inner membrane protein [Bordetella ansorpii]|uniref:ABC transporter inner membrane protein n=1 Tax=Bordetella ansorpii TaxID=288768 RepID=A0A157NF13_9BORD|nr:ABC transporter permease [Bordetella ansorpii]SAI19379.1 ABC transporter inner membrane protein [Bordetella ansorpii]